MRHPFRGVTTAALLKIATQPQLGLQAASLLRRATAQYLRDAKSAFDQI